MPGSKTVALTATAFLTGAACAYAVFLRRSGRSRRAATVSAEPAASDAGRRPSVHRSKTLIIGIGGASGSGKTSISNLIRQKLPASIKAVNLSFDSYYKTLGPDAVAENYNFDHPDALDVELVAQHIRALADETAIEVPQYDFTTHKRLADTQTVAPPDVVLLDGIFTLCVPEIRALCNLTIFTVEDLDVCLARRLKRDIVDRGRTIDSVLKQYQRFVKPAFQNFIGPSMIHADIIVPRARDNRQAISLIVRDIVLRCAARQDIVDDSAVSV